MQVTADTPRSKRTIGAKDGPSFEVSVPQPYTKGPRELSEGEANALNQIIAENLSNNLRAKLVEGRPAVKDGETVIEAARAYTVEEAQALVDAYLAEYEIGVRRAGSGERQVTDPVEREARNIARSKAREMIKAKGGKPGDYDLGPIVDAIFEANKDVLMREGKKIVAAAEKAREAGGITLEGIALTPKPPAAPAAAAGTGGGTA